MSLVRVSVGGADLVLTVVNSSVHFDGFVDVSIEEGSERLDKAQPHNFRHH